MNTLCNTDYYQMKQFITESNWNTHDAIDMAAKKLSKNLPMRKLAGLTIDEAGTVKKGEKSVGLGWQCCGNAGKTSNSQQNTLKAIAYMQALRLFIEHCIRECKQIPGLSQFQTLK